MGERECCLQEREETSIVCEEGALEICHGSSLDAVYVLRLFVDHDENAPAGTDDSAVDTGRDTTVRSKPRRLERRNLLSCSVGTSDGADESCVLSC